VQAFVDEVRCMIIILCKRYEVTNGGEGRNYLIRASYLVFLGPKIRRTMADMTNMVNHYD
jgi:hypothetical protein